MVLMIARREAAPCEQNPYSRVTFSKDTQVRIGKQLLAAENLTKK
jgi:hypothetical protein